MNPKVANKGNHFDYRKNLSGILEYNRDDDGKISGYLKLNKDPKGCEFNRDNTILKGTVIKYPYWITGIVLFCGTDCVKFRYLKLDINKQK